MNRRQSLVRVHFCWPAITKGEASANRPIDMGRGEQTGHSRRTRGDSSAGNLGYLGVAKVKRGVGGVHSSGEAGQCPWSEGIPRVKGNVWNRKRESRLSEKTYTEEEAAHSPSDRKDCRERQRKNQSSSSTICTVRYSSPTPCAVPGNGRARRMVRRGLTG